MPHLTAFSAHIRAVQAWGAAAGASLNVDLARFELEVKCRGRYYQFHPQFFGVTGGQPGNTDTLTPGTRGFAGWRPYRPFAFELSVDKLRFKAFCEASGLRTPRHWLPGAAGPPPAHDYILKRSIGSYGHELAGPYPAGTQPSSQPQPPGDGRGALYAERFVRGRNLKLWCWGGRPVCAHIRELPVVTGDGRSTARHLVGQRLDRAGVVFDPAGDHLATVHCLRLQGIELDDVPPAGQAAFFDYRYGRECVGATGGIESEDALPGCDAVTRAGIDSAAAAMAGVLRQLLPAPVLYSLDGVIEADGQVGWLEVNANPTMPPEGYAAMLGDLFGA